MGGALVPGEDEVGGEGAEQEGDGEPGDDEALGTPRIARRGVESLTLESALDRAPDAQDAFTKAAERETSGETGGETDTGGGARARPVSRASRRAERDQDQKPGRGRRGDFERER